MQFMPGSPVGAAELKIELLGALVAKKERALETAIRVANYGVPRELKEAGATRILPACGRQWILIAWTEETTQNAHAFEF